MPEQDDIYAVTREDEGKLYYAFGPLEYVKSCAENWDGTSPPADGESGAEEVSENVFTHHSAFSETLRSAVDFCLSQYQIMMLLSSLGSTISQSFIKSEIHEKLKTEGVVHAAEHGSTIYKLDGKMRDAIYTNDKRADVLRIGAEKIGPSVFLGMVASFDALIVEIVGKLIQQNPSRFVGSDKSVSMSDVLNAESIDQIVERFVEEELFRFSRESHDYQNSYIEKQFSIQIRETWKRYPDFIEVFERRNLIAHGEATFNARYVSICEKFDHKGVSDQASKPLELRPAYQKQAIYLLSEYAILLAFVLWRKHASEKETVAFETLNEAAFKLIQDGHYLLAERILTFALSLKNPDVKEEIRKMMVVNNASAAAGKDNQEACVKLLEKEDWSASSLQFQLSVAALKANIDDLIRLAPQAQKLGFEMVSFRIWPVFRFVRSDQRFNDLLEELYGERLVAAKAVEEQNEAVPEQPEGSVH